MNDREPVPATSPPAAARTCSALFAAVALALGAPAKAEGVPPPAAPSNDPVLDESIGWKDVALFAGGVATAFVGHELGHATANLAFGNVPHLESVSFAGVVPFFAVAPDINCVGDTCFTRDGGRFGAGRRGLLLILLAGFDVQHITDEVLLSTHPALRFERAPFRTGLLAFNTLTSAAYVIANLGGFEPPEGDVGAAVRNARAPRALTATLLLGIAATDAARWAWPEERWLPWVSRAAKVVFLGMPLAI